MDDALRLRAATEADLPAIADLMGFVFHDTVTDESRELEYLMTEWERSVVVEDGPAIVGHTSAQTRELSVPGGVVPAAHVTAVGVAPTHRRQGLLNALMRRQILELAEAGREPVAVLTASESAIYPRYGYGLAASRLRLDVASRDIRFTPAVEPAGRLRVAKPKEVQAELAAVHDQVRAVRPGMSSRGERLWRVQVSDLEEHRHGATELRAVICDGPDGPLGYALWRVQDKWDARGPAGEVQIRELLAEDPATYAKLWNFLMGLDLTSTVKYDTGALDEPLSYLVDEPRRLGARLADMLWLRIVDLPAALEARRYPVPVDLVLEITDPMIESNSGRWRLTGGPDKATCVRTSEPAVLACSVTDLGALYLGGTPLAGLVAAGRVRHLGGPLPSAAFGWHRQPNPIEVF